MSMMQCRRFRQHDRGKSLRRLGMTKDINFPASVPRIILPPPGKAPSPESILRAAAR